MSLVYRSVGILVAVLVVIGLLNGGAADQFMAGATAAVGRIAGELRSLLLALGIPALLLGGVVAISPRHRVLGAELAVGGVIAVATATLGPLVMHWFAGEMATQGASLLGAR